MFNVARFLSLALLLLSTHANAQTISKKKFKEANSPIFLVNGFINFSTTARNQGSAFEKGLLPNSTTKNNLKRRTNIRNDSQIFFKTGLITESKERYGLIAKTEFNFSYDGNTEYPNLDQIFLFRDGKLGKIELGNNQAVNQKLKSGPATFARGAGGINGKYLESVNLPISRTSLNNLKNPSFILLAQSPIGHGGYAKGFYNLSNNDYNSFNRGNFRALKDNSFDGVEDATKLSYYTPRLEGLKFGLSYAPNSSNSGITSTKYYNSNNIQINDIFSIGINYLEYFNNLRFEISATAEKGNVKNSRSTLGVERHDLSSYDLGLSLSYFGFDLGASYGSWGKSLRAKSGIYSCDYDSNLSLSSQNCASATNKFSDPYYYTAGIAYIFGPIGVSVTGLSSEFENSKYNAISFGLDYKWSKDLKPYFELTKFNFNSNQPSASDLNDQNNLILDNKGYVFLTGILISF